jgi:hypothetical protein
MCPKRLRANDDVGPVPAALSHALTRNFPSLAHSLSEALVHHVVGSDQYSCVTRQYIEFCEAYSIFPWPVHSVVLGAWILQLCTGISVRSLGVYLAGVKYSSGLLGYRWLVDHDCDIVRRVHRFVKRKYGLAMKNFKTSVTLRILRTVFPLLPGWPHSMSHDDRMLTSASMLGLMGCLRGGEFTVKTGSKRSTLLHSQVTRAPPSSPRQGVQVDIEHPKGKWWLTSQPVFAFEVPGAGAFGVATLLDAYRAGSTVALRPDGPAFVDHSGRALTRDVLVKWTEALLQQANIVQLDPDGKPTKVMSSSFRAGHVKGLKDADVSDPVVMASGRWVSSAWTAYYALQASDLEHASSKVWECSEPAPPGTHRVGRSSRSALEIACAGVPLDNLSFAQFTAMESFSINRRAAPTEVSSDDDNVPDPVDHEPPMQISYRRSAHRSACDTSF